MLMPGMIDVLLRVRRFMKLPCKKCDKLLQECCASAQVGRECFSLAVCVCNIVSDTRRDIDELSLLCMRTKCIIATCGGMEQ